MSEPGTAEEEELSDGSDHGELDDLEEVEVDELQEVQVAVADDESESEREHAMEVEEQEQQDEEAIELVSVTYADDAEEGEEQDDEDEEVVFKLPSTPVASLGGSSSSLKRNRRRSAPTRRTSKSGRRGAGKRRHGTARKPARTPATKTKRFKASTGTLAEKMEEVNEEEEQVGEEEVAPATPARPTFSELMANRDGSTGLSSPLVSPNEKLNDSTASYRATPSSARTPDAKRRDSVDSIFSSIMAVPGYLFRALTTPLRRGIQEEGQKRSEAASERAAAQHAMDTPMRKVGRVHLVVWFWRLCGTHTCVTHTHTCAFSLNNSSPDPQAISSHAQEVNQPKPKPMHKLDTPMRKVYSLVLPRC